MRKKKQRQKQPEMSDTSRLDVASDSSILLPDAGQEPCSRAAVAWAAASRRRMSDAGGGEEEEEKETVMRQKLERDCWFLFPPEYYSLPFSFSLGLPAGV